MLCLQYLTLIVPLSLSTQKNIIFLHILDIKRPVIGQFSRPYSTVQPAKSNTFFGRSFNIFKIKRHISY